MGSVENLGDGDQLIRFQLDASTVNRSEPVPRCGEPYQLVAELPNTER